MNLAIEFHFCHQASVMNLMHTLGFKHNSKLKQNGGFVKLNYVELTEHQIELIKEKANNKNWKITTKN